MDLGVYAAGTRYILRLHRSLLQTKFVGMMQYDGDLKLPAKFLVPPPAINGTSGELLAKNGVSTFACSETQKFGHVRPPHSRFQAYLSLCTIV